MIRRCLNPASRPHFTDLRQFAPDRSLCECPCSLFGVCVSQAGRPEPDRPLDTWRARIEEVGVLIGLRSESSDQKSSSEGERAELS